ncbi:MAG: nucleotidyltransferase domain-containing protein [Muribaculaceae bacterium]|nr:nucleotidyltransferase domain-containing protein [Muribaculaceae bacterium]
MKLSASILSLIKNAILSVASDAVIYLYGSQARGDARPDSDIDLLIILPDSYEGQAYTKARFNISDVLYDLWLARGLEISPMVVLNKIYYGRKTPFTVNIANEGIRL